MHILQKIIRPGQTPFAMPSFNLTAIILVIPVQSDAWILAVSSEMYFKFILVKWRTTLTM